MNKQDFAELFDLSGRNAIVIGAGRGIGAECAMGLAALGARVVCCDRDVAAVERIAHDIDAQGQQARALSLDVDDPVAVAEAARQCEAADVLLFTVGMNVRRRLLDLPLDDFEAVVRTNMRGAFLALKAFVPAMLARGKPASIILLSSIRALTVEPGQAAYAAAKAGLVQLSRVAAAELAPRGIRVNVVVPGVVQTPLTNVIWQHAPWREAYASKTMLGRWAEVRELVGPVLFLASDASSYMTGATLVVDGGWTACDGRFEPPL